MVSLPIPFRNFYGSGMGIVWEGVPLLGVPLALAIQDFPGSSSKQFWSEVWYVLEATAFPGCQSSPGWHETFLVGNPNLSLPFATVILGVGVNPRCFLGLTQRQNNCGFFVLRTWFSVCFLTWWNIPRGISLPIKKINRGWWAQYPIGSMGLVYLLTNLLLWKINNSCR